MYLLSFIQGDYVTKIGLLDNVEQGREVIKRIPGYEAIKTGPYLEESFDPEKLPAYMELNFQGNIVPLSKFMFVELGNVIINWEPLPELSVPGEGVTDSATRVDAYMVENEDVKEYIKQRENNYQWVKKSLEARGYEVDRAYFGSEDGEAILYRKKLEDEKTEDEKTQNDWHFLTHMDPAFVEENKLEELLDDLED